jgi:hypothetical protein
MPARRRPARLRGAPPSGHRGLPAALREDRGALTQEGAKVGEWSARYAVAVADWPIAPVDLFFNVTRRTTSPKRRLAARFPDA